MMKLVALNSGGIDSPAAMHLMLENGVELEAVSFDLAPFTDQEDVDTAVATVEQLEERHGTAIPARVVPHGFVQEAFLDAVDEDDVKYNCLFSRRVMLKTAARIAAEVDADGLLTGESMGQVASQTLDNLVVTGAAVDIPVYRPLIGMDKMEIEDVARDAGTYSISTQGGISCAAVIDHPETHGAVEEMEALEQELDVAGMVQDGLDQMKQV